MRNHGIRSWRNPAALAVLMASSAAAEAVPIWDTPVSVADYSGQRSTGALDLAGAGDAGIVWAITGNGDGSLHYAYTLTTTAQNTISHFILDLSDNCTAIGTCFNNLRILFPDSADGTQFASYSASGANPYMPGTIGGVKIDGTISADGIFSFGFDSDRAPVWGDFYAKGGNPNTQPTKGFAVWNLGLADHLAQDAGYFIAVPDTVSITHGGGQEPIPEPSTALLLGAGLLGFGATRRLRRR
jgi:hypothetical protein